MARGRDSINQFYKTVAALRAQDTHMQDDLAAVRTPISGFSPIASLLRGRSVPRMLARLAVCEARRKGRPLKFGNQVIAVRHADVSEVLQRDLDFLIAPINSARIVEVNGGPFVLGMDRSSELIREREALYAALVELDLPQLEARVKSAVAAKLAANGSDFDAIGDYARRIAAATAKHLFGIQPPNDEFFMEAVRAIFAHTFLNIGGDAAVEARARAAAPFMEGWFTSEIERRRAASSPGDDLMGILLRQRRLDDEGIRRTLGGMLVGSIDTTASTFARVFCVIAGDAALRRQTIARWRDGKSIYGLCLDALRRWPHNPILLRQAAADTVLGGVSIKAGARVVLYTQAAMQDPDAFPDPERALADRPMANYLHYGAGLHPCAGRVVNAIQIPALVGALLEAGAKRHGSLLWAGPFPDRMPVRVTGSVAP